MIYLIYRTILLLEGNLGNPFQHEEGRQDHFNSFPTDEQNLFTVSLVNETHAFYTPTSNGEGGPLQKLQRKESFTSYRNEGQDPNHK